MDRQQRKREEGGREEMRWERKGRRVGRIERKRNWGRKRMGGRKTERSRKKESKKYLKSSVPKLAKQPLKLDCCPLRPQL